MLPQNPYMLLSVVNTRLRDAYPTLDVLCEELQTQPEDLCSRLAEVGYGYSPEHNQFIAL